MRTVFHWMCAVTTALLFAACTAAVTPSATPTSAPEPTATERVRQHLHDKIEGLPDQVTVPQFVDSFPNHAQTITLAPAELVMNFDLKLGTGSVVRVQKDGQPLGMAEPMVDARQLALGVPLPEKAGDGLYFVEYHACFANGSCGDGRFGFKVDAGRLASFKDLRGQSEVTIELQNVMFQMPSIIVSPGTRVTWINRDPFEHFVNSDPHPSHNAHPKLNSLDIPPGESFRFTFEEPGEYTYHCSAHVPQNMFGTVIVSPAEMEQQETAMPTAVQTVTPPPPPTETSPSPTVVTATLTATGTVERPSPTATFTRRPPTTRPTVAPSATAQAAVEATPAIRKVPDAELPPQRFAAHFVASQPAHADLLGVAPRRIEIQFDFTLARNSNLNVIKDGEKLNLRDMQFSENRLAMSAALPEGAGAGTYHVLYRACWPDRSCHDGEFAFRVEAGQ